MVTAGLDVPLHKARICVEAGASGFLLGRNMWQRPFEDGLHITE